MGMNIGDLVTWKLENYDKTIPLFMSDDEIGSAQSILGFKKSFLSKLKSEGFSDLKSLVKYRKEFKSLSDLINT